jgi:quercetin dioxygenase-like cupin family protein
MEIFNWNQLASERVMETQTRKVIHTPKTTIVQVTSQKGTVVPLHHHVHEQVTLLVSGAFHYELEGRSVQLRPGDVLRIPSNVPHPAEALEDSVTLEVFVPAREDWIRDQQKETR